MKDPAYYRDLINQILTENTEDPEPRLPSRSEIEQRKIAHLVKTKRLPSWLQQAKITRNSVTCSEYVGLVLNRGWTLEEWELIARPGHPDIEINLWLSSGYPLDPPSDPEIAAVTNNILSEFFNTNIDDIRVSNDYSEVPGAIRVHSATVDQLVLPWLAQLWK